MTKELVEEVALVLAANDGPMRDIPWDRMIDEIKNGYRLRATALLPILARQRNEGIEAAAKALEADAKLCDCHARSEGECACGAWNDYKSVPMHRAVEIVRNLKEPE